MRRPDHNLSNIPPLKSRRRELRNAPIPTETILWRYLQRRQLEGTKFRRQHSIGRYVVDFFCVESSLAIELDGQSHYEILRQDYEAERTAFLEAQGIEILRFENREVFENIEAVLETIRDALRR